MEEKFQGINYTLNKRKIWTIFGVLLLLITWKLASILIGREIILPSPESTFDQLILIIKDPAFIPVMGASTKRLFLAFFLDLALAILLGTLAYIIKPLHFLIKPTIIAFKSIPTMAVVILALIWLGSEGAPFLVCSLIVFPILYSSITAGYYNIDKNLLEMHRIFRIPLMKKIKGLYIPSIMPYLKSGIEAGFGLNVKALIAAEVLSQPELGIGSMFQIERASLNTPGVFAWSIIVISLTGGTEFLIKILFKKRKR